MWSLEFTHCGFGTDYSLTGLKRSCRSVRSQIWRKRCLVSQSQKSKRISAKELASQNHYLAKSTINLLMCIELCPVDRTIMLHDSSQLLNILLCNIITTSTSGQPHIFDKSRVLDVIMSRLHQNRNIVQMLPEVACNTLSCLGVQMIVIIWMNSIGDSTDVARSAGVVFLQKIYKSKPIFRR